MTSMVQTGYRFEGGVIPRQRPVPVQEEIFLPVPTPRMGAAPTVWPPDDDEFDDLDEFDDGIEEEDDERPRRVGRHVRVATDDAGMATAEYAVATLAACGFAGLLVTVLRSGEVEQMLLGIIRRALTLG